MRKEPKGVACLTRATFEWGEDIFLCEAGDAPFGSCKPFAMLMPSREGHRKAVETWNLGEIHLFKCPQMGTLLSTIKDSMLIMEGEHRDESSVLESRKLEGDHSP